MTNKSLRITLLLDVWSGKLFFELTKPSPKLPSTVILQAMKIPTWNLLAKIG